MELHCKHFTELSAGELFSIYKLRVSVFVVEQHCPYQEADDADPVSFHLWLEENGELLAYCRVLPKGAAYPDVSIGRVIAVRRREGLGTRIVSEGIRVARERFGAESITLGAQVYARRLYEKLGFIPCSEPYPEDGIPHIDMRLCFECPADPI